MNRWRLVQELFEETIALDPSTRARVLHDRTEGDDALARQVEALVAADATPLDELDRGAADLMERLRDEPPPEALCGTSFGPYRIDEHLSSGGMAHVYLATRTSAGTERRVALKVLRPGLDTESFPRRFQRERELLAALEHEHIVAFLDAGARPDGRPYLVMEVVDGVELTRWGRDVPLRERLGQFVRVLAAVQYAHRQLVVHRDLKPSNVLVTSQGAPKLLDFGVATVLETEGGDASGRGPLTPLYASPEQLRGEPVTAASDIWSLGVLLHELAVGERPGADTAEPDVTVGGDLGAIVRKALAIDPARRYRSADQFAEDVRRFLDGAPVSARPATFGYRASLFARRHRGSIALAAAVVVALVVGWVGAVLDRRYAERDASLGWGAHAEAKVVARVFERWIARTIAANPALGDDVAAHLEATLRDDLRSRPEAETMVRLTLASLYLDRGDRERAAEHAERAWSLAQTTRGVGHAERERAEELRARTRPGGR